MPMFIRKFVLDFVETGFAALVALGLIIPATTDEGKVLVLAVGTAILGAFISAGRRAIPGLLAWLKDKLGVTD